ncbi:MAG: hypothetical protein M9921_06805 [Fimbriimonadaceae bacterium]|nr:hypothetical protein [Fimbriimonadaceae bacterium]
MLSACLLAVSASPLLVRLPVGGIVPDVAVQGSRAWVAYGDRSDAYVAEIKFGDQTLTPPVRVNSTRGSAVAGGERGPQIAAGTNALHVAWQGPQEGGAHVWYARSANGGKGFESQRDLLQGSVGVDMVTVAAMGKRVVVLWLDGRGGEDPRSPATSLIYYVESTDGGNTFGPNTKLEAYSIVEPRSAGGRVSAVAARARRACACCTMDAQFTEDGTLKVLYRSGEGNIRDVWLLERPTDRREFSALRVSEDNWSLKTCPMDGPRYFESVGRPVAAWMSDGRTYWAERAGETFLPRKQLADGPSKYPSVARGADGSLLGIWEADGRVHWRDLPDGSSGAFDSSGHRSALFVAPDGRFTIVN